MRFTTAGNEPIAPEWINIFLDGHRNFPDPDYASERREFLRQNQIPEWTISRLNSEWSRLPEDTREALLKQVG